MSFRLRTPIAKPSGRKLHILLYARYSTEEQDASSIPDQFAYCRQFLHGCDISDAQVEELHDSEMSGELVFRPGINNVREGIAARRWHLIVVEDSSRLFRNENACGELVDTAVDHGIRVIAINDDVDTAEEDWDDRLHEAARHHARTNKYTAKRIKRKLEALWRMGAAIGMLHSGYRRKATNPDAENPKKRGPFFDEVDPTWSPVVYEAWERIAHEEAPWLVGQWLTEKGLPKPANAKTSNWTDKNVISLIKNPIYRGVERYRVRVVNKERRTGKHVEVRNDPGAVLTRDMPHLRIVPDWLWYAANEIINKRTTRKDMPLGRDHPLFGVPRESRGPLSGIFVCGICGGKMIVDGRREGGYRCSNSRKGSCWNKANPLRSVVHAKLGTAIANRLLALDGVWDGIIAFVQQLLADESSWTKRHSKLKAREHALVTSRDRLLDAIENGKERPAILTERLAKREDELVQARAELQLLDAERHLPSQLPSKQQIKEKIKEQVSRLLEMDRAVRPDLKRLVSTIRVVPYQQFGTTNVVLRAHFELKLASLLPDRILSLLKQDQLTDADAQIQVVPMVVDLFDISRGPAKYWAQALKLHNAGNRSDEIAKELCTNRTTANRAVRYAKALGAAGLSDPFVKLDVQPSKAGRWRVHKRFKQILASGTDQGD